MFLRQQAGRATQFAPARLDDSRSWHLDRRGRFREGDPVVDEYGHDWQKPPLRQRMVGDYLEVCVQCGIERVGPRTKESCAGAPQSAPYVPRHRAE